MGRIIVLAALAVIAGCASPASTSGPDRPRPSQVTLVDSEDDVAECKYLRDITVEPPLALLNRSYPELAFMAREDLRKDLRRETAEEGGDAVLPTELEDGTMHGKAYDCPS